MSVNAENNIDKVELKEFKRLQKKYKTVKKIERRKKVLNVFQHILFLFFPCSCIKSEKGNKIANNLITFGLQLLGIITQLSSFLVVYEGCLAIFSNPAQFISKLLSAIFIFVGGLYLRIISARFRECKQTEKNIIGTCVCAILLFLIFYLN